MARPLLLGVAATLAVEAVVAVLVVASGVVDVAATPGRALGGLADRVLGYASTRSIAHHAKDAPNPLARDPAALAAGLRHYREMCVACHGGPGAEPGEFAAGLHPPPPDLASPEVQAFTDGMLYDTVARGIGSTGMPAFGRTHRPEDIWSIVAFVRHLRELTPEEKRALGQRDARAEAHQDGEAHGGGHAARREGEGQAAAPAPDGAKGRVHAVAMTAFKFDPPTLTVHVGDVVEWKNADFAAHTATADDHSFDTGGVHNGEAKRVVAKKQGRFPYFCRYHAAMKGTLVVE